MDLVITVFSGFLFGLAYHVIQWRHRSRRTARKVDDGNKYWQLDYSVSQNVIRNAPCKASWKQLSPLSHCITVINVNTFKALMPFSSTWIIHSFQLELSTTEPATRYIYIPTVLFSFSFSSRCVILFGVMSSPLYFGWCVTSARTLRANNKSKTEIYVGYIM